MVIKMESRKAKLIVNKPGGTASEKSRTYRVTLPNVWIEQLGLNENSRDIELSFDGNRIIIDKAQSVDSFIELHRSHKLLRLDYYNYEKLCTTIIADYTDEVVKIQNYTDEIVYIAFGVNENPTWQDYLEFLEERCVPESRAGLREYLDSIGVDEYNPIDIIRKTEGRMAEDHQWIRVIEL